MAELLSMQHVSAGYGEAIVLDQVSLSLQEGDSLALLGRNGVGKTTLLTTLMGITRMHGGSMRWRGSDLLAMRTHSRARAGLGWVPQERSVFPSLTVEENLTAVAMSRGQWDLTRVYATFPRLAERKKNMGNQLSGGEQQMLAVARALMLNPGLLLLDEPMEGLAPLIVQEMMDVIHKLISESGMAVMLAEQHAELALSLTKNVIVLDRGRVVHASGSAALLNDPAALQRLVAMP
jgi:branched-chain amino acid transport system ATP-binding protein